ncbi:hypothetical protein CHCC14821_0139 [Bacillus paralicheniformis]|nr:hypothetical protein CHCC14821_0139 [Bacillus paralicheniformis]
MFNKKSPFVLFYYVNPFKVFNTKSLLSCSLTISKYFCSAVQALTL